MISRLQLSFIIILLTLGSAQARQESGARPMSLQDCIDFAFRNADTLKNARLNILKQEAVNNQVRANALPRVNLASQLTNNPNPQKTLVPAGILDGGKSQGYLPFQFSPTNNANATVSASQAIFDGTVFVALKARNAFMEATKQASTLTEEGLKYQIAKAYYAIVIGQEQFKNVSSFLAISRDISHDLETLYKTGFAEKIDVERSMVQVTNLETDSIKSSSLLETGEQSLKFIIGMDLDAAIVLTDTIISENLKSAADLLSSDFNFEKRTEFQLLKTSLKINKFDLQRYQLSGFPTLNLIGNAGYNYGSNKFNDLTDFYKKYLFSTMVGVQLNFPIFNGLLRQNQVKQARITIDQTENNIHYLRQALDFQVAQAKTALKNELMAVEKQRRNVELSNSVLDLARRKYKAGVGSNLEVNQAQTDLLQSQNNYYSSLLDAVNAQTDLQKALGEL